MSIKQIRLSSQAKEQLIRLKTRTGVQQWNILCRWAFCLSLAEPTPPTPIEIPADSNVEMTWHVFGGEWHEMYLAVLKQRCLRDCLEPTPANLNQQFRLHLHRGIAYLATPNRIKSISDLVSLAVKAQGVDAGFQQDDVVTTEEARAFTDTPQPNRPKIRAKSFQKPH